MISAKLRDLGWRISKLHLYSWLRGWLGNHVYLVYYGYHYLSGRSKMTFNGVWDYFRIPTICTDLVTFLGICGAGESLDDAWFKLTGTSCSRWPSYSSNGGFRKWRIPKETIQTWSFFGKPTAKPTGISVESPAEVRRIRPPWNPDAPSRAVLAVRARAYRALALGCWKDEFSRPPVPCLGTSSFDFGTIK